MVHIYRDGAGVARWFHRPEVVGSSPTPGPILFAGVAQLVEQVICNHQVESSSLSVSSIVWRWLKHIARETGGKTDVRETGGLFTT